MGDLKSGVDPADKAVFDAYENNGFGDFLRAAVKAKWNILLSGGTSSGKTTWLRACLGEVDNSERIMTIEDVLEIRPSQPNAVSLVVNKNASSSDLLKACLRFRPERIIMGELRGAEAYDFLSAINSGHPGWDLDFACGLAGICAFSVGVDGHASRYRPDLFRNP